MSLQEHKIPYFIVDTEQNQHGNRIQASHHGHHLVLNYEKRETPDGLLWFGSVHVDGQQLWASLGQLGCRTMGILDAEMQHQLCSWAMRMGYAKMSKKHSRGARRTLALW